MATVWIFIDNSIEKVVMSTNIFKFNDYKKRQERSILISNKALLNLKGTCNRNFLNDSRETQDPIV
jgi:serum/glucocorticoid-regulated kinase 2